MISANYSRNLLVSAVVLLSAATLAAQVPGGGEPNPGGQQQPMPGAPENSPGAPGTAGVPGTAGAPGNMPEQTSMQNMVDKDFIRNTLANDADQIQLSQLAQQKSTSPDVKQFSEQMVKVHDQLNTQLGPVAKQMGVDIPKGPTKKEKKEIQKMQSLSGQDFESAYLENMDRMQRDSLKQFHNEVHNSQNASLRDAASQDSNVLTQNYQILQKIAQAHNVNLGSTEKK